MTGIYRIAEKNIRITSLYSEVHTLCSDYHSAAVSADFTAETSQADIVFEQNRSSREAAFTGSPAEKYSEAYLETLAVYRKIAEKLPLYDTFLIHGSCIAVDGAGYLFTAKSGTGKSTHARLWRELLGERAFMVNDDKPVIRITEKGAMIYGTPWCGKHRLGTNTAVPLKALCILERSQDNRIVPVSMREAYPFLVQQVYRPADPVAMRKTLNLIDHMAAGTSLWHLYCNMDIGAARIAYDGMNGGNT